MLVGHLAHAATVIDPKIKFRHGELSDLRLGGQELLVIGVMIVPVILIYFGIFLDFLKK
ncbi:MAG: hypothetical protein ACL7AX_13090 [Candidatus Arsenophonus phytopathogenicus]